MIIYSASGVIQIGATVQHLLVMVASYGALILHKHWQDWSRGVWSYTWVLFILILKDYCTFHSHNNSMKNFVCKYR